MNFAPILPIHDLDLSYPYHFHMLLAWAADNETYSTFYKNRKKNNSGLYYILDNGANEDKVISGKQYIDIAYELEVSEIIAPDVYQDYNQTLEKTYSFIENDYPELEKKGVNLMAVLQGKTFKELLEGFEIYLKNPKIDIIGIGYRNIVTAMLEKSCIDGGMTKMTSHEWEGLGIREYKRLAKWCTAETLNYTLSRIYFLRKLVDLVNVHNHFKKIHLLGLFNPYELLLFRQAFSMEEFDDIIRACDSAAPVQAAQVYVEFDMYGVKTKPKKYLDMFSPLGKKQREIAEKNLQKINNWIDPAPSGYYRG